MDETKKALMAAMEAYFGEDQKRINHAHCVTEFAEQLWQKEGGDYLTVFGAGVLHDIGIHQAEKKYGSPAGKYQEIEGPPIARQILADLSFSPERIDAICEIVGHHHSPGKIATTEFCVLYDADWLVNLKDEYDIHDPAKLASIIDRVFLTRAGKALARETYLGKTG